MTTAKIRFVFMMIAALPMFGAAVYNAIHSDWSVAALLFASSIALAIAAVRIRRSEHVPNLPPRTRYP